MGEKRRLGPAAVWLGLALLLGAHAAWLFSAFGGAFSGPDAPGYLLQARQLATEGTTALHPESPAQYVDLQFLNVGDGEFRSRYPPGVPALQALPYRLGGVPAALAIHPLLALLGGVLLFLLARRWTGPWLALLGVLIYATLPILNDQALMGMAHVAVTAGLLGALLALDLWSEGATPGRALVLGLILGALPALRYPAAVPVLILSVVVAIRCVGSTGHRRTAPAVVVGVAIPLAALLIHNFLAYGSPLATGYGVTGEDAAFGLHYLQLNAAGYLRSIGRAAGAVALFGVGGIVAMLWNSEWRSRGALLAAIVGATTLLYASYYWSLTGPRFLLPVFAVLILAGIGLIHLLPTTAWRGVAVVGLTGWHLTVAVPAGARNMDRLSSEIRTGEAVLQQTRNLVPRGSVLIAPLPLRILAGPYGEWKLAEPSLLWPDRREIVMPPLHEPPEGAEPVSPMQDERTAELRSRLTRLEGTARTEEVLSELREWSGPVHDIYFVGDPNALAALEFDRSGLGRFVRVGEIRLPGTDGAAGTGRYGGRPDFRFWIHRPPLEVYRFTPADLRRRHRTPAARR